MTSPTPEQRVELRRWATDIADNDPDDELANRVLDVLEWGEAAEAERGMAWDALEATLARLNMVEPERDVLREQVSVLRHERDAAVAGMRQVLEARVFPEDTVL